ncbi:MAG: hypothetical protein II317_00210 [Clostridia bacterium]|nr:hypothetical protein [Clostridia bacterium]
MKKYIVPELMLSVYEENAELCNTVLPTGSITTNEDFWTDGNNMGDRD